MCKFCPPAMTEWVAACMDPDEWTLWRDANRRASQNRVDRPCQECPLAFALEMRSIGRCNGEPSGAPEDEEDEPMEAVRISTQRVTVDVSAPCATCLHRDVCAIKADVDRAGSAEVGLPTLSPALKPRLSLELDCAFYLRDRGIKLTAKSSDSPDKPKSKLNLTPEDRERRRQQALAMVERQRQAKAEREAA